MINWEYITITDISSVIYVSNNFTSETITHYPTKSGLPTNELIFRIKGDVETHFDGKVITNPKNTIEFLPKNHGDTEYWVRTVETGECIDIFFDTNIPLSDVILKIESKHADELRALFIEINKLWFRKEPGYYARSMSVLYKILSILISDANTKQYQTPHYKKIEPAIHYLNKHYCSDTLNYTEIAEMCDMSYSYFRRLFTECIGVPPVKYVINKRIDYAKDLLVSGHYSVSEIAELSGFSDVYYFSHIFKKLVGYSPTNYQKTQK